MMLFFMFFSAIFEKLKSRYGADLYKQRKQVKTQKPTKKMKEVCLFSPNNNVIYIPLFVCL